MEVPVFRSLQECASRLECVQRGIAMRRLIYRCGCPLPAYAVDGYDRVHETWGHVRVLVVGAGGIGCEVLHLLAVSGFSNFVVIDMDTVELSNLNRQFLFSEADVGRPKSLVAADFVKQRCPGVVVDAVVGRIEDQPDEFYSQFDLMVLCLDSVSARRWINSKVAEIAVWEVVSADENDAPRYRITRVIPMIDTGAEGYQSHCRVINMAWNATPCIECEMYLFDAPRATVPMCTLESIPRSPEHCVLYVQFKLWSDEQPGEELDPDDVEHIRWIAAKARARQLDFGIGGELIDEGFTVGVVRHVVPTVGFTNALIAGAAVTEVLKMLTGVAPLLDNYLYVNGAAEDGGIFSHTQKLLGHPSSGEDVCSVCGPRPVLKLAPYMTPADVREALAAATGYGELGGEGGISLWLELMDPDHSAEARVGAACEQKEGLRPVHLSLQSSTPASFSVVGQTLRDMLLANGDTATVLRWCRGKTIARVGWSCVGGQFGFAVAQCEGIEEEEKD